MKNIKDIKEVRDVNQLFENEIHRLDQFNRGRTAGQIPFYPMIVIFLGDETIEEGFPILSSRLTELWPQFRRDLLFLGIRECEENLSWQELSLVGDEVEKTKLQDSSGDSELLRRIQLLYGADSKFRGRHSTLVYYVMCTSRQNAGESMRWMKFISTIRSRLEVLQEQGMKDLLLLLLDEGLQRQKDSVMLRNALAKYCEGAHIPDVNGILLLSNVSAGGTIDSVWGNYYCMLAELIALSNNQDYEKFTRSFFGQTRCIMTVSYSVDGKQVNRIAKAAVGGLLDAIEEEFGNSRGEGLMKSDDLRERLGLQSDGYLRTIFTYVDNQISRLLPSEEELEYFPRESMEVDFFAEEFDEQTMGAWKTYLSQIRDCIEKEANAYFHPDSEPIRQYTAMIRQNFTNRELAELGRHKGEIRAMLKPKNRKWKKDNLLESAREDICYQIACNEKIVQIFTNIIEEESEKAGRFLKQWSNFLATRWDVLQDTEDEGYRIFYGNRLRNGYIARNLKELIYRLDHMEDISQLGAFFACAIVGDGNVDPAMIPLHNAEIPGIIPEDKVYAASFEEELCLRTNNNIKNVMESILRDLTRTFKKTYLRVNLTLSDPHFTAIMTDTNTALCQYLRQHYRQGEDYYNTGDSNRAILLMLHMVSARDILGWKED